MSRSFGGVAAVNRVSFALEAGHIYGLIGPNGSGKTTLFNCITGLERLDAGRVQFKGERIDGLKPSRVARMGIGRTFQVIRVFPELTALENLLVVTRGARADAERRGREMLEFVKLERLAGEYAGNLSYGQQKLVEFVRVLMTDPALILLDEPAAGVNRTLLNDLLAAVTPPARRGADDPARRARHESGHGAVRDGVRPRPRREDRRRTAGPDPGRRARD